MDEDNLNDRYNVNVAIESELYESNDVIDESYIDPGHKYESADESDIDEIVESSSVTDDLDIDLDYKVASAGESDINQLN